MRTKNVKIEFYKERPFGERMNVPFLFMEENKKEIIHNSFIFFLPVVLILSFFFTCGIEQILKISVRGYFTPSFIGVFIGMLFFIIFYILLIPAFSIGILQLYNSQKEQVYKIKFIDTLNVTKKFFVKMFYLLIFIVSFFFICFWMLKSVSGIVSLCIGIILFLTIGIPILLMPSIYLMENIPLYKSIIRSFQLGYKTWGSTFLLWILFKLITLAVFLFGAIPGIILANVEIAFFASSSTLSVPLGYQVLIYIAFALMIMVYTLCEIFLYVGMSYQYAHAFSYRKNVIVVDDINQVEHFSKESPQD